jgi:hypothetical protein
MMESLPVYVSIVFIATTIATAGFLLFAAKQTGLDSRPSKITIVIVPLWLVFTAILAVNGFYLTSATQIPRIFAFGAMPVFLLSILAVALFRPGFVEKLPLKTLTFLHIVRIPVEFVLFWLLQAKLVPQAMTFEGHNFDILSGLTAPIVFWLAFRNGQVNRPLLIVWNLMAFVLLSIVVATAIVAFPSPMQKIAFDQPNLAVAYFPFIWLPSVIVPIVFFAHLAGLWQLISRPSV